MSKSVLLIDDEEDIREVAKLSLEMVAGWVVHTAADGAEGLRVAAAQQPDAILLDVMMPDMDGPTVLEGLQAGEGTRAIPVVFLTAKTQAADRERLSGLGAAGVLTKPFDPMMLADDLAAKVGWPR